VVSKLIGGKLAVESILPLIKKLMDDDDIEVARKAISSFMKHSIEIFPSEFLKSEDFKSMLLSILRSHLHVFIVLKRLARFLEKCGPNNLTIDDALL